MNEHWLVKIWKRLVGAELRKIEAKSYNKKDERVFQDKVKKQGTKRLDEAGNEVYATALHPKVQKRVIKLIAEAHKAGLNVDLFEGYRSFERQNYLYNVKKTTKAKGGRSWHNYGLAVDVVFKDSRGRWSWANKHDWKALGLIGKKLGFTWGGDWGWDMAHFEYHKGIKSTRDALKMFNEDGKGAVWKAVK